jgi:hypothetical protein
MIRGGKELNATNMSQGSAVRYHGKERRSAQRWRLHEPVQVRLSGGDGARNWRLDGVILNATPRGLACRIPARRVGELPTEGSALQVGFELEAGLPDFELRAEVRTVTEAGTPGYCVVGMEFKCDSSSQRERERLRAALDAVNRGGEEEQAI